MNNYPQRCLASTICRRLAALIVPMLLAPCFAAADTITTFDVSGTCIPFAPFTGTTFGGTFTIDVTTGTLTGIDVTFQGLSAFTHIDLSTPFVGNEWTVNADNGAGYDMILTFSTGHTPGSLVGFTGGTIETGVVNQIFPPIPAYAGAQGSITTAVPDGGSSLALLGVGLGLMGLGLKGCRALHA